MRSVCQGKFITLEGIEGSGKSLQLGLLEGELKKREIPCLTTHEPGGTPFGQDLREILLRADGSEREPVAELLLYLADRFQHWKQVIQPALSQGRYVICDRYHDATLAYQGNARGLGFDQVNRLASPLALGRPDLTLVLDVEVEAGLARARQRNQRENLQQWGRFEAEDIRFHQKVREGYHMLAEQEPDRVLLLDGSGEPQLIHARMVAALESHGILEK